MYEIEISHKQLNKYRVVRDRDLDICENKAEAQKAIWREKKKKRLAKE
ncbi:MAG: hypothetical protein GY841_18645 [FCB group bacterium]|nr:hypothetical protein [FCB group bacterium]